MAMKRAAGPVRYIVQWKQRTFALGFYDESQWITASVSSIRLTYSSLLSLLSPRLSFHFTSTIFQIESSSLFRVEGLIPGVQYRFMITVVGPNGRLGTPSTSDWIEATAASSAPKAPCEY